MTIRGTALTVLLAAAVAVAGCSVSKATSNKGSYPYPARPTAPTQYSTGGPSTNQDFAPEVDPNADPQSTFALDVDTASYTYATAQINNGARPNPTDVRPEEFINSFAQDYPQPARDGFTVSLDGAHFPQAYESQSAGDLRLLRVGLQTRAESPADRSDAALTFVIDVSGSMGDPGKLSLVKDALHTLIDQLRPTDSVAIVTFDTNSKIVRAMTSASRKADLHGAIEELQAHGSTNLAAGLATGYRVAREGFRPGITNRVVILSDGLANNGATDASTILAQVRDEAAKQITLLGVGVGSNYGDALMEQLADRGDGFVVYVSDPAQARKLFVEKLPATLPVRAMDAKAQVTFDPNTVAAYRLIGYDDRAVADSSFRNDHVDGGEVGAGHSVTALYAVRLRTGAFGHVAEARVRWLDPTTREAREAADSVSVTDLDVAFSDASPRLQVCYAAGYFAEVLRGSPYGDGVNLTGLANIAAEAADRTDDSAVSDLAAVIRRAAHLG